jgi:hypothetical protein
MSSRIVSFRDPSVSDLGTATVSLPTPDWRTAIATIPKPGPSADEGIEVGEQELCRVTAQRVFMVRCECGRRWFELELPALVECPACHRLGSLAG